MEEGTKEVKTGIIPRRKLLILKKVKLKVFWRRTKNLESPKGVAFCPNIPNN